MAEPAAMRLVGEKDVIAALDGMAKQSARNRVARPAIRAGASIVSKAAKRNASKANFTDSSGALKRSIGIKMFTGRRGVVAVIGARQGQGIRIHKGVKRNPFKYSHLVEKGTTHSVAKPFLEPAFEDNKAAIQREIRVKLREGIIKEARRQAKKAAARAAKR